MGVGVQRGVAEKQAQVQIGNTGAAAENHAVNVHHHHAGEIKQVEAEGAPDILHGPAQRVIAQQRDGGQQDITGVVGQGIGNQPPDLTVENACPVEAEKAVQQGVAGHRAEQVYHSGADGDIQHQVGNALIPVFEAEKLELFAKIFHLAQLLT